MEHSEKYKFFEFGDHAKYSKMESLPNPYEPEIDRFVEGIQHLRTATGVLAVPEKPTQYGNLEDTPFTFVETTEQLSALVKKLEKASEIAIDLEHHSVRTYLGLTCLMQISTRSADFVVDVIKLHNELGDALRHIFDDPTKAKVLHGANSDIEWLQRDFGLYVVNMFDTG